MKNKKFLAIILVALLIKFFLFVYAEIYAPQAKFQTDTIMYSNLAENLASHRVFTQAYYKDGSYSPELFRTPGYPLFLCIFHYLLKIHFSGVIIIQIMLTILAAFITYKTAIIIGQKLGYLSAIIMLIDFPITIFSLMLITESLFLFLVSLSMLTFILYLKNKQLKFIISSAIFVAMATYVRPLGYFMGLAAGIFLIYFFIKTRTKKILFHLIIFLFIVYGLIGIWHFRNYKLTGSNIFTNQTEFVKWYKKTIRNDNELTRSLPPALYHLNAASRCVLTLMTHPGSLKDFNSYLLRKVGKFIAYPWVVFWMIGFLVGLFKIENNFHFQFLAFVVLYFICASVGGILFGVSSRMRVPMMPFIAIISANGWMHLISLARRQRPVIV